MDKIGQFGQNSKRTFIPYKMENFSFVAKLFVGTIFGETIKITLK